jgi:hypothetical protein
MRERVYLVSVVSDEAIVAQSLLHSVSVINLKAMLTRFFLNFTENEAHAQYLEQRTAYYSRVQPLLAAFISLNSLLVELAYRLDLVAPGVFNWHTTFVNWIFAIAMIALAILVRKHIFARHLTCPLATIYVFYYYSALDFGESAEAIYN